MSTFGTGGFRDRQGNYLQEIIEEFLALAGYATVAGHVHSERVRSELFLRSMVENELVPRVLAFSCLLLGAEVSVIHQEIPDLLRAMSTALPSEAEFLTMMSRRVDTETYAVYTENLEFTLEMSWAVETFEFYLVYLQNGEDWDKPTALEFCRQVG